MVCMRCGISPQAHGGLCYGCSVHFHGAERAAELQREHDERHARPKIILDWVWLNPANGTYTTGGPNPDHGWTERVLVPFEEDAWGLVPVPDWD